MSINYNPIRPEYYDSDLGQPIDFISRFRLPFNLGNVVKYICRAGKKEKDVYDEDYQKAKWYLDNFTDFTNYKNCWCETRPCFMAHARRTGINPNTDNYEQEILRNSEDMKWAAAYASQFRHDVEKILIDIAMWAFVNWDLEAYYYLTDAQKHMDSLIDCSFGADD